MHDLVNVKYIGGYVLELGFENGKTGNVDFAEYLQKGGVFKAFQDINYFRKYYIDPEVKVLCWPDGIDIDPEMLYHKATGEPLPAWAN